MASTSVFGKVLTAYLECCPLPHPYQPVSKRYVTNNRRMNDEKETAREGGKDHLIRSMVLRLPKRSLLPSGRRPPHPSGCFR